MRVAVITGPGRVEGIGAGCVRSFLRAGYQVVGIDKAFEPEVSRLAEAGGVPRDRFRTLQVDLADGDSIAQLPERIAPLLSADSKGIDVLINNAGIAQPYLPDDPGAARIPAFQMYLTINLAAPFLVTEALRQSLNPDAASIIHISSIRAIRSEHGTSQEGYAAAKAGLLGLTHSQAAHLGPRGVRVNAILPGHIDSGAGAVTEADHRHHWVGRVGTPGDIAGLALFLADPAQSGFITAQAFGVDGGISASMVYPD